MYFPVLDDLIEVKVGTFQGNQAGINVLHYRVISVSTGGADLNEIAENLSGEWAPLYAQVMANTASFYGVRTQKILPGGISIPGEHTGDTTPGTAVGAPIPGQVAGVATLQTDLSGRANRGRFYAAFPATDDIDPLTFRPTDEYVVRLDALAESFKDEQEVTGATGSTTLQCCILHRIAGTTTPVTGARANQRWGTQRRRGNYGQANAYPPF